MEVFLKIKTKINHHYLQLCFKEFNHISSIFLIISNPLTTHHANSPYSPLNTFPPLSFQSISEITPPDFTTTCSSINASYPQSSVPALSRTYCTPHPTKYTPKRQARHPAHPHWISPTSLSSPSTSPSFTSSIESGSSICYTPALAIQAHYIYTACSFNILIKMYFSDYLINDVHSYIFCLKYSLSSLEMWKSIDCVINAKSISITLIKKELLKKTAKSFCVFSIRYLKSSSNVHTNL